MHSISPAPLWDEGISTYLLGEQQKLGRPLAIDDLQAFAQDQAIRIGDIIETLFLLAIYGEWQYTDRDGAEQALDEEALDALYARGRLSREDLAAFDGVWSPVG